MILSNGTLSQARYAAKWKSRSSSKQTRGIAGEIGFLHLSRELVQASRSLSVTRGVASFRPASRLLL